MIFVDAEIVLVKLAWLITAFYCFISQDLTFGYLAMKPIYHLYQNVVIFTIHDG